MEKILVKQGGEVFVLSALVLDSVANTENEYTYLRVVSNGSNNPIDESNFPMIPQSPANQVTISPIFSGIIQGDVEFNFTQGNGDHVLLDQWGSLYRKIDI